MFNAFSGDAAASVPNALTCFASGVLVPSAAVVFIFIVFGVKRYDQSAKVSHFVSPGVGLRGPAGLIQLIKHFAGMFHIQCGTRLGPDCFTVLWPIFMWAE